MAEQITIRFLDPADGKTYDIVLDESSKTELASASPSVTIIKTKITAHANNTFSADDAEKIAIQAVQKIEAAGLLL